MPKVCIVKHCPSDQVYGDFVTFHGVPIDDPDLILQWQEKLDFKFYPLTDSTICSLHFNFSSFEPYGDVAMLCKSAIPLEYKENGQKLLNKPSCIQTMQTMNIKSELHEPMFNDPLTTLFVDPASTNDDDRIYGFSEFALRLSSTKVSWKGNWKLFEQPDGVCLYRLRRDENFNNVTMSFKILINSEMLVSLYQNEDEASIAELNWILKDSKLELWSQFLNLASHYQTEPVVKKSSDTKSRQKMSSSRSQLHSQTGEEEKPEVKTHSESDSSNSFEDFPLSYCAVETNVHPEALRTEQKSNLGKRKTTQTVVKAKTKRKKVERKTETLNCTVCEKVFEKKAALKYHIMKNHEEPFYCDQCGKKLMSRKSLLSHMVRIHAGGMAKIPCSQCGDLLTRDSMKRHIRTRHQGLKPFGCELCGKNYTTKTSLQQHEAIHHKTNIKQEEYEDGRIFYKCPKCSKQLQRGGQVFAMHVSNCNGILTDRRESYRYNCFECDKKFVTRLACAEHLALHHNYHISNLEKFCFICKQEFEELAVHVRIHNCTTICPMCGFRLKNQEKLERHIRLRHRSDEARPFPCDQCQTSFKILNHLRSHQKIVHSTEVKQFVCDHCNKGFVFKYLLTSHIRYAHSDIRRFTCSFCGMKFKINSHMKDHCRRVHGEENAYPCTKCTAKVRTLNELKNHLQDEHGISMNPQKYHDG